MSRIPDFSKLPFSAVAVPASAEGASIWTTPEASTTSHWVRP